ncbi:MAG: aminotransferase class V-fold PLP-dependent enzyme [Gammaproteobacteria bacterium]
MTLPVYLDFAASTPVASEVVEVMTAALRAPELVGNPATSSGAGGFPQGHHAFAAIEAARLKIAALINSGPDELVFCSGATEADNLAIIGGARFRQADGRHVITALGEHKAVLESVRHLAANGWRVTWLKPDPDGIIRPEAVAAALEPDTTLVSLMHANNETGVLLDVAAIGALCRQHGALFHVDAAQSAGRVPIDVRQQAIDLLSLSAHKIYGPKGIGALFIDRERVRRVEPLLFGGGQERGIRPGTLATHQIIGMGEAFRLAAARREADRVHVTALRDRLWSRLATLPDIIRNGHAEQTTGHILNVSIAGVEGESLHAGLQAVIPAGSGPEGPPLAVASGSACTSQNDEPSYVLRILGRSAELARSSIRFSFGRATTTDDIDAAADRTLTVVSMLRRQSPAIGPPGWLPPPSMPDDYPGTVVLARGEAGSEALGTWVAFNAWIAADRLVRLDVQIYGCPHTREAGNQVAAGLSGRPVSALEDFDPHEWRRALGIPVEKTGRMLIIQDALRKCLADWDNGRLSTVL